ncbi:hypothetical protein C7S14_2704 [Burkholderia cepacia]|nr:hypothetical protein C7S14_2704 [Burkholderia cepacia]
MNPEGERCDSLERTGGRVNRRRAIDCFLMGMNSVHRACRSRAGDAATTPEPARENDSARNAARARSSKHAVSFAIQNRRTHSKSKPGDRRCMMGW